VEAARRAGARLETETAALGVYPEPNAGGFQVLLATQRGLCGMHAKSLVIATGGHDRLPPFPGNDLPGVFSAQAALRLLAAGVLPGEKVVIVGDGEFAAKARARFANWLVEALPSVESVRGVEGRTRARALIVADVKGERRIALDTLVFAADASPAVELAVQAGARVRWEPARGYVPELNAAGETAPGVRCVGWASGAS
jgi:sarcosine oxidase subunit alpha